MSNNNNTPSLLIVLTGVLISISLIAYSVYATSIGSTITTSGLIVSGNTTTTNLVITTNSQLSTVSSGTWQGTPIADAYVTSSLTISGGTINNTPIGLDTPSTGAFTTLRATGTSTLATTTISGRLGVGTTTTDYTLDVDGNIRATKSLTSGINVETLNENKILTPGTDEMYQYLDPNGATRTITLATSTAHAGDKFVIRNNAGYASSYRLGIKQGDTTLDYGIYAQSIREYIFDGTNWVAGDAGTGIYSVDSNVGIGQGAVSYARGAAVGYGADANTSGAAVGYQANSNTEGSAIGYQANGNNYGVAVGNNAKGEYNGVSVGYRAGYSLGSSYHNTPNKNTLLGYKAGYNLTEPSAWAASTAYALGDYIRPTTANGYNYEVTVAGTSGSSEPTWPTTIGNTVTDGTVTWECVSMRGNNNILIGYDIEASANDADTLNIGNLIYGTGLGASNANVGIGTSTPQVDLHIAKTASSTIRIGDTSKTGCVELGGNNGTKLYYIYVDEATNNLVTTTTKPAICE